MITLLACSFMFPSWGLAALRGSLFCCSSGPAARTSGAAGGHAAPGPASHAKGHAGHGPATNNGSHAAPGPASHASGHAGHAPATHDAGHAANSHDGGRAGHGTASHDGSRGSISPDSNLAYRGTGSQDGVTVGGNGQTQDSEAQAAHPFCGLLSCAQAPAAGVPESFPQIFSALSGATYPNPAFPLPAPSAQSLYRPPRA
ncbi:MAG: hypothetical protein LBR80_16720 [Deltaproteobacteria bacterium]|nr:hypothetical protein [Deltaproteobacteria bacterium]